MIEIEVKCGCGRAMRVDATKGRGHMACGCGARVYVHMPAAAFHEKGMCTWVNLDERGCKYPTYDRVLSVCEKHLRHVVRFVAEHRIRLATRSYEQRVALRQLAEDVEHTREEQEAKKVERQIGNAEQQARRLRAMVDNSLMVVYYARLREGVIKIGYTSHLSSRMADMHVPPENLLAVEPGDYVVEKARHRQFVDARLTDSRSREEFREGGELTAWIEHVRELHGPPAEVSDRNRRLKIADLRVNGPLLYPSNRDLYDRMEAPAIRAPREAS